MPSLVGRHLIRVCVGSRSVMETSFESLLHFVVGEGTVNPGCLTARGSNVGSTNSMVPEKNQINK